MQLPCRIGSLPAEATLACTYTSNRVATSMAYQIPPALRILSPQRGETVTRSKATQIT